MTGGIAILLFQDGFATGLIYALLALSILMVYLVTRVLWVPSGDFVAFGALTLALLNQGRLPGIVWLVAALAAAATAATVLRNRSRALSARDWASALTLPFFVPLAIVLATMGLAQFKVPREAHIVMTIALLVPVGYLIYGLAFQPIASRSVLVKLIVAVAVHYALTSIGLVMFGAEGLRVSPYVPGRIDLGFTRLSFQLLLVLAVSLGLMAGLWLFFERTLWGAALRAAAVNRFGAQLMGIRTDSTGALTFAVAAAIGAVSGVLIAPMTTVYYDSGFLIALKGFIGVVAAGMLSFPVAVAAAVTTGIVEAYSSFYASALKEAIVFALLIPVLVWRSMMHKPVDGED